MKEGLSSEQKREKNKEWARVIAKRFSITLDASEENFIVPLRNEQGEERGKEIIPAGNTIPFKHKGAVLQIEVEQAIKALQNHPELNLAEALIEELEDAKN